MIAAAVAFDDELDNDCTVCRVSPEMREAWGCERDTPIPLYQFECWACRANDDEECKTCGGTRQVGLRRCPRSQLDEDAVALLAASNMLQAGVFPAAGSWEDQAATFCDAVVIVGSERAMYWERTISRGNK